MEQTYRYRGPVSAVTLPAEDAHPKGRHVQLFPGRLVTLPDDNAYVKTLLARGHLTLVPAQTATLSGATATTAPASSTTPSTTAPSAATSTASAAPSATATATTTATASATGQED